MLATEQKIPNCLDEGLISVAGNYFNLQSVYTHRLDEVNMFENNDSKECKWCGTIKLLTEFYYYHNRHYHHSECKECTNKSILERRKITKEHYDIQQKKYRDENKDRINARSRGWYERNRARRIKIAKEWSEKNREHHRRLWRNWIKTPNGKISHKEHRAKYIARKRGVIATFTFEEWIELLVQYGYKCAYCGKSFSDLIRSTQDHIIPISKGGDHTKDNIVPACLSCNCRKGNRDNYKEIFMNKLKNNMR